MGDAVDLFKPIVGFTPVRRRECSQQCHSPDVGQAPWTTSRCNRLLRPLSTRIAALRKENEGRLRKVRKTLATKASKGGHVQETCVSSCIEKHQKDDDDPDWSPDNESRTKPKRTYSSRGNHRGAGCLRGTGGSTQDREAPERVTIQLPLSVTTSKADGDGVPTDLWNDPIAPYDVSLLADPPEPDLFATLGRSKQFAGLRGGGPLRKLAQTVSPDNWIPINRLYDNFDTLLRGTSSTRPKKPLGTRSLFATCIRKVPQCISFEHHASAERGHPEDIQDVALSVYMELETLSQSENVGWRPLREIVRSHGVSLLKEAILDFTIPFAVARGLVTLCEKVDAIDEAEELVASMMLQCGRLPKPRTGSDPLFDRSLSLPVFTLKSFAARNSRYGFLYRQLATAMTQENIPIQWISSPDMAVIWNMAITHMAENGVYSSDAGELIRAVVSKSIGFDQDIVDKALRLKRRKPVGRPRKRKRTPFSNSECSSLSQSVKDTTLISEDGAFPVDNKKEVEVTTSVTNLLTVLSTVNRMRHGSKGSKPRKSSIQVLFDELEIVILCMHELSRLVITRYLWHNPITVMRAALSSFIMTALKQHPQDDTSMQNARSLYFLRTMMQDTNIRDSIPSALCGTILCYAKAQPESSITYFQDVQQSLLSQSASIFYDSDSRYLLRKILIEAAFEFADETKKQRHMDWALELEETIFDNDGSMAPQAENRTPMQHKTRNATGWRWEEGISEWIARTPGARFLQVQIPNAVNPMSESDELAETEPQISQNLLGSSPLRTTSSNFYVRIERDRRKSAPSQHSTLSRTSREDTASMDKPLHRAKRARQASKLGTAAATSKTIPNSSEDESDELSKASSSQGSSVVSARTAARRSRPILREISNLTRCHTASQGLGKDACEESPLGQRALTRVGLHGKGRRAPLAMMSLIGAPDQESDDELGF